MPPCKPQVMTWTRQELDADFKHNQMNGSINLAADFLHLPISVDTDSFPMARLSSRYYPIVTQLPSNTVIIMFDYSLNE